MLNDQQVRLRKIVTAGLLIALNIVLTRFMSFVIAGHIRIGFGLLPTHIAGYLLGPLGGFAVGAGADLLGVMINSFGQTPHPGMTLSSGLQGLIPGLLTVLARSDVFRRDHRIGWKQLVIVSSLTTGLLVSWLLQSLWLSQLQSLPYTLELVTRGPGVLIQTLIYMPIEIFFLESQWVRKWRLG